MTCNGGSRFCLDCNSLELRKFGTSWNGGNRFRPDCNDLEWRKSVLARLDWLGKEEVGFGPTGMEEVTFSLTGMAWNG
jgi:hypothetical protein